MVTQQAVQHATHLDAYCLCGHQLLRVHIVTLSTDGVRDLIDRVHCVSCETR